MQKKEPVGFIIDLEAEQAKNQQMEPTKAKKKVICKNCILQFKNNDQLRSLSSKEMIDSKELLLYTFPHKNIDNIVKLILNNANTSKETATNQIFQLKRIITESTVAVKNSLAQIDSNLKIIGQITNGCGVIKCFPLQARQMRSKTDPVNDRFDDKKIVAKALCKKDYGISSFKQQLLQNKVIEQFTINSYKTCCYSVVTQVYRRLQKFLLQQCKKKVKPIDRFQMRSIFTILLNCNRYFDQDNTETFHKFAKLVYGMQNVTITQQQAKILYITIQQVFINRLINKKSYPAVKHQKYIRQNRSNYSMSTCASSLDKKWSETYQKQLITVYHHHNDFKDIRQYFREMYPRQREIFTIEALRSRFYKIIRSSLKKLSHICQNMFKEQLPNLIKLNELKIKCIQRSGDSYDLRLLLIDFYTKKQIDLKIVYSIIVKINEYITMKDKQRLGHYQSSRLATNTETEINGLNLNNIRINLQNNVSIADMDKRQKLKLNDCSSKIKKYPSINETLKKFI